MISAAQLQAFDERGAVTLDTPLTASEIAAANAAKARTHWLHGRPGNLALIDGDWRTHTEHSSAVCAPHLAVPHSTLAVDRQIAHTPRVYVAPHVCGPARLRVTLDIQYACVWCENRAVNQ